MTTEGRTVQAVACRAAVCGFDSHPRLQTSSTTPKLYLANQVISAKIEVPQERFDGNYLALVQNQVDKAKWPTRKFGKTRWLVFEWVIWTIIGFSVALGILNRIWPI